MRKSGGKVKSWCKLAFRSTEAWLITGTGSFCCGRGTPDQVPSPTPCRRFPTFDLRPRFPDPRPHHRQKNHRRRRHPPPHPRHPKPLTPHLTTPTNSRMLPDMETHFQVGFDLFACGRARRGHSSKIKALDRAIELAEPILLSPGLDSGLRTCRFVRFRTAGRQDNHREADDMSHR